MEQPIHTEDYRGLTIKIIPDFDPPNPRTEGEPYGMLIHWHSKYDLGFRMSQGEAAATVKDIENNGGEVLPVYMYAHSGIVLNTTSYSCPWDSGQVGFIYITADQIREMYMTKRITKKLRQQVRDGLESAIKEYSDYLSGNVFGYVIEDSNGNEVDSCWGFIGDYDSVYGALHEAIASVNWFTREKAA